VTRVAPSRYASKAVPTLAKKKLAAQTKHLQAPVKGLSLSSKLATADAFTASILDNWTVEKDRITIRPGLIKISQLASQASIETILPFYGAPNAMLLAAEGKLYKQDATLLRSGFNANFWAWTSFSNLGDDDYTVAVNGADGVWSWNGGTAVDGAPVTVTSLSNANPAVVTVAAADIGKFHNGDYVKIVGADATHSAANGNHQISSVNTPVNTFTLVGVNTSAATGPQTSGVDAIPLGSLVKETLTAPAGATYCNPQNFHLVLSHMNRLWFADHTNLALFYLPLQQKSGQLKQLPLNALFRRGGSIRAIYTWTLDGGAGTEDQLVIFSSNGEAVIYGGTDPDTDFALTGIFRFDAPMSMRSVINYGGDLYAFISTGLVPMSTMLRAEAEQLGVSDKNVTDMFAELTADRGSGGSGWEVILDYNHGWAICNFPSGAPNVFRQMIRFMPDPIWASWSDVPARTWQWLGRKLYCASDTGALYEMSRNAYSDDGRPITADVMLTWSTFGTSSLKKFQMVRPYIITDGIAKPYVDIRVDYDDSPPLNQPDVSIARLGGSWDTATWDVDYWQTNPKAMTLWNGVSGLGGVGAPRIKVTVNDCHFALAGIDVVYEIGAVVG